MIECKSALSTDEALELLADRRRRTVLRYLVENGDEAVTIDELLEGITAETSTGTDPGPHAPGLAADLYHVHLPKLADAGLVEFDGRSETVRYRPHPRLEDLLQAVSETTDYRHRER